MTADILAEDVKVGDDIVFLGKPHRVLTITSYPRRAMFEPCMARIAYGPDNWALTLIDGQRVRVAR